LRRLSGVTSQKVLSVGGGFDTHALYLAQRGNEVTCVDVSSQGLSQTYARARELGIADKITTIEGSAETLTYNEAFGTVVVHKALHHMDFKKATAVLANALKKNGTLYAEEPVCLWPWLCMIHQKIPFHPDYPVLDTERELAAEDIVSLKALFSKVTVNYFNCFTRPSLAYFLGKMGLRRTLAPLSMLDFCLIKAIFFLRYVSSHVVVEAVK